MLSPGVAPADKDQAERLLRASEEALNRIQPELDEAQPAHMRAQHEAQQHAAKFKDAKQGSHDYDQHKEKVELAKRKLREAEKEASKDNQKEKKKCISKIRRLIEAYVNEIENASKMYDQFLESTGILSGVRMSEDGLVQKKNVLEEQLREMQLQTKSLEQDFQRISVEFNRERNAVAQLKQRAEEHAPLKDEAGKDTPLKVVLDALPSELAELEDLMDDAKEKIKRILDNPEVLRQYREKKQSLESQKDRLENLKGSKGIKRAELDTLKAPYEASLHNIVKKVNDGFGKYMTELGCAGKK